MPERKKFEIRAPERKPFEIRRTLSEIEPIEESNLTPQSREDLARLVEAPLLEACQVLFDKNIGTWMSSANKKDVAAGEVYIIIYFDTLSPRNKEIALQNGMLSKYLDREYVKISMPVDEQTTAGQISKHMIAIASEFESQ